MSLNGHKNRRGMHSKWRQHHQFSREDCSIKWELTARLLRNNITTGKTLLFRSRGEQNEQQAEEAKMVFPFERERCDGSQKILIIARVSRPGTARERHWKERETKESFLTSSSSQSSLSLVCCVLGRVNTTTWLHKGPCFPDITCTSSCHRIRARNTHKLRNESGGLGEPVINANLRGNSCREGSNWCLFTPLFTRKDRSMGDRWWLTPDLVCCCSGLMGLLLTLRCESWSGFCQHHASLYALFDELKRPHCSSVMLL